MSVTDKLKSIFKKSEEVASEAAKKATKAADLNKDGKLDTKDAQVAKDKVTKTAAKATKNVKKAVNKKK